MARLGDASPRKLIHWLCHTDYVSKCCSDTDASYQPRSSPRAKPYIRTYVNAYGHFNSSCKQTRKHSIEAILMSAHNIRTIFNI